MTTRFLLYFTILALCGCASNIPISVKNAPVPDPEYQQVKQDVEDFKDQNVRWGGQIISVENKEDSTWIEILASPLDSFGRPSPSEDYEGRFIARINGFLDPKQYSEDRAITIFGIIDTVFFRKIDDYTYSYPLVSAKEHYLWSEYSNVNNRYYDNYPFYYPFGYRHFYSHHRYNYFLYPRYYY